MDHQGGASTLYLLVDVFSHLRTMDAEILRANLLPSGEATVTQEGIRFRRIHYTCEHALQNGWFSKARTQGRWKVSVNFDPRSTDVLYLRPALGLRLERCILTNADQRFSGRDWSEIDDFFRSQSEVRNITANADQQARANHQASVESILEQASKETNAAIAKRGKQSKRERVLGIKENQRAERALERHATIVDPVMVNSGSPAANIVLMNTFADSATITADDNPASASKDYIPRPSRLARSPGV